MSHHGVTSVIFDLGGVLIDWNPRYLYRQLIADEVVMEQFLADVCSPEWNARLDAGHSWADEIESLAARHPEQRELIVAYRARWSEMVAGAIDETVQVLAELRRRPVGLYALSNWSAETFPLARERFDFLGWFDGILLSGEIGICKPDPRIFRQLIERYGLEPARTVFVDDLLRNVEAADQQGMAALQFRNAAELRSELVRLGLLK
ncbi:HAD-IA family hydrolase [soil metagenome]